MTFREAAGKAKAKMAMKESDQLYGAYTKTTYVKWIVEDIYIDYIWCRIQMI